MAKKSITVTDRQDEWIQPQLASGRYATDSQVIREAIREKQLRTAEIDSIRAALVHAEECSFTRLGKEDIRQAAQTEMKGDGDL
ncbi:MAG: type II toxin-antitoxin system ParD family antitoxin [Rhodospirillales bacterium]|nr:type II toxin-antitoxin system ParD family antitoxin [Rhodospirillales bacterium]